MNLGISEGVTGAKRATWRSINPRELMRRIIEQNRCGADGPTPEDEQNWRELFWQEVEGSPLYLRAVSEWFAQAAIRALVDTRQKSQQQRYERQEEQHKTLQKIGEIKQTVREHIVREAHILLLDLMMPNGQKLAQCTGNECRQFGGWFASIANKVPAKKRVGDVLSEGEVRKIWLGVKEK